ncbi:glycosyltransferase family A protein [Magnetofaba australis]|uniref:Putative glycosyl transferase WbiE n=1 Tax=Magnetofaba australis IT-1 TaxID=1434232 RepID=A0A1Y2K1N0_9PROT|nr:glycosyltransferase family A protein [Magnetofaba australis]OSM01913.1 putative glycosyl transferase WbiE [Magnetofaba australis IT-1]
MNRAPAISVIVRTAGARPDLLLRALDSLAQQSFRDFEIILSEAPNCALDTVLASWRAAGEARPALRRVVQPHGGRSQAGNLGVAAAHAPLVCFLDDDDVCFPHHLHTLHHGMRQAGDEVSAVYAKAIERRCGRFPRWGRERVVGEVPFLPVRLWLGNFLPIQAVLMRKSRFQAIGGFDPELDALEDWDLWLRLSQTGAMTGLDAVTSRFDIPASGQWRRRRQAEHAQARQRIESKLAHLSVTLRMEQVSAQRNAWREQFVQLTPARDLLRILARRLRR